MAGGAVSMVRLDERGDQLVVPVRCLVLRDKIDGPRARAAVDDLAALEIVRYPHGPPRPRIWELRDNLSADDASYVALAEALSMPLLTSDARIVDAPGVRAEVRVLAA